MLILDGFTLVKKKCLTSKNNEQPDVIYRCTEWKGQAKCKFTARMRGSEVVSCSKKGHSDEVDESKVRLTELRNKAKSLLKSHSPNKKIRVIRNEAKQGKPDEVIQEASDVNLTRFLQYHRQVGL